jgi:hypothetical protein
MATPIFVSYSSKDETVARTICDALESRGLKCWIANRDVAPGENFQEAIFRAIRNAKVMVLVFTQNANNSDEIKKELGLASHHKVVVIPVRVEDVLPNEALSYELTIRQWIDIFDDWERGIERLSSRIESIDASGTPRSTTQTFQQVASGRPWRFVIIAALVCLVVVGAALAFHWWPPGRVPSPEFSKNKVLKGLQTLLAPFKLPAPFVVQAAQCGQVNAFYNVNGDGAVTICHELIDWIERNGPKQKTALGENVTREDTFYGPLLQVTMHLVAHAVVTIRKVPSATFAQETNIDYFAAFILMQSSASVMYNTLVGTAIFEKGVAASSSVGREAFSATHGSWSERLNNHFCIAYQGSPTLFGRLIEQGLMPRGSTIRCPATYEEVKTSFAQFVLPYIDRELFKQIQSRDWKWQFFD